MNKILLALVVILGFSTGYLLWERKQLKNELIALTEKQSVNITPIKPQGGQSGNPEASPFDKPQNDALLNDLPDTKTPPPLTTIKFERLTHDYGRIDEGAKVKTTFKFTNTGDKPLIISSAVGSCGCTVPNWPKAAIAPGEGGVIDVQFDSEGKHGQVEKSVTVTANCNPPSTLLTIKATIVPKDK